jgi:hypothetical protein
VSYGSDLAELADLLDKNWSAIAALLANEELPATGPRVGIQRIAPWKFFGEIHDSGRKENGPPGGGPCRFGVVLGPKTTIKESL